MVKSARPLGLLLCGIVLASFFAAAAEPTVTDTRGPLADLVWFMAGLKGLQAGKDARLKLTRVQARKILPELENLVDAGVIALEARRSGDRAANRRRFGEMTEDQRKELAARLRKTADLIEKALSRMEGALTAKQMSFIINLPFDPAYYGLGRPEGDTAMDRAAMLKWRRARQAGLRRLIALNREVMAIMRKLAR